MSRLNVLKHISLPTDIINYIYNFLSGKCEKCFCLTDEINLFENCIVYKYYNIFDDRYFFPREMEEFNYLCNLCKNRYSITSSCDK